MVKMSELSEEALNLIPTLDALSEKDRVGLAHLLLAAPDEEVEPDEEVKKAWKEAIQRRVEELRSGKVKGVPIEEMFRRSHEKLP
jgi:putative addiction module component (TIGR02574 family)